MQMMLGTIISIETYFDFDFSSVGDKDISPIKTFVGIRQIEDDYIFMCSTGTAYR